MKKISIDFSPLKKMFIEFLDIFKDDYKFIKSDDFVKVSLQKAYHLHSLVGVGMVFMLLISFFGINQFNSLLQQIILITLIIFLVQASKELIWGLLFKTEADFRDARMGTYAGFLTVVFIKIIDFIIPINNDWFNIISMVLVYGYVIYLFKFKK